MEDERPTLGKLASQAKGNRGIKCPQCGCLHCTESKTAVKKTIALGRNSSIERVRYCPDCGRRFVTWERVVGNPAN